MPQTTPATAKGNLLSMQLNLWPVQENMEFYYGFAIRRPLASDTISTAPYCAALIIVKSGFFLGTYSCTKLFTRRVVSVN